MMRNEWFLLFNYTLQFYFFCHSLTKESGNNSAYDSKEDPLLDHLNNPFLNNGPFSPSN